MRSQWLITLFILIGYTNLYAQVSYSWAKTLNETGANGNDGVQSITTDAAGNIYTAGYFTGTMDADPGPGVTNLVSAGLRDIFVAKYTDQGALIWAQRAGSTNDDLAFGVAVDGSGNVLVTGYFLNTVDFDPGPGTLNLAATSAAETFVWKLNSSGNLVWAKEFNKTMGSTPDQGYSIKTNAAGDVFVCGIYSGSVDFDPSGLLTVLSSNGSTTRTAYIAKLTSAGNYSWAIDMKGSSSMESYAYKMDVDASSNIYVTGWFYGTVDFDPTAGTTTKSSQGEADVFVAQYNPSGTLAWVNSFGSSSSYGDRGLGIKLDGSGNVYLTGYFSGTTDFNPGSGTSFGSASGSSRDVFVSKFNTSGTFTWANSIGSVYNDAGTDIDIDGSGFPIIGGYYLGTVDFNPGAGSSSLTSSGLAEDAFVFSLDDTGVFQWASSIGGTSADVCNSVRSTGTNGLLFGGYYQGNVDFDPSSSTSDNFTSTGSRDAYFSKWTYCQIPEALSAISGPTLPCPGTQVTYTVPASVGATSYTWTLPSGYSGTSTTNSITITAGSSGGTLSVAANNACGTTPIVSLVLNSYSPLVGPTSMTGTSEVCALFTSYNYQVFGGAGATSYTWTLPSGWTGSSTSSSISAMPTTSGSGGVISVYSSNACESSTPLTFNVSIIPAPANPVILSYDATTCLGVTEVYGVMEDSNVDTYVWTVPSGWTGSSDSSSISVSMDQVGIGTMFVQAYNACGGSQSVFLNIEVNPNPIATVSSNGLTLTADDPLMNSYAWLDCNNGMTAIPNENGITYSPVANGSYALLVENDGCYDTSACVLISIIGIEENTTSYLKLFPNPSNDKFTVEVENGIDQVAVYSTAGELMMKEEFTGTKSEELRPLLNPGVYLVKVTDTSGNLHVKQWIKI